MFLFMANSIKFRVKKSQSEKLMLFIIGTVLILNQLTLVESVEYGFTLNGSCAHMEPVEIESVKTSTTTVKNENHDGKNTTTGSESSSPSGEENSGLKPMTDTDGYKIVVNDSYYRRKIFVNFTLEGPIDITSFMVEVQSAKGVRTGQFVNMSPEVMGLNCDGSDSGATAVINAKGVKVKNVTHFYWQSGDDDMGDINIMAKIVSGDQIWTLKSDPLTFKEFPPSLKSCNSTTSCSRVGSEPNCNVNTCEYILTWHPTEGNKTLLFTLGGQVKNHSFLGVGFLKDINKYPDGLEMINCYKIDNEVEVKAHVVNGNSTVKEFNSLLGDTKTDSYGNYIWCSFERPFEIPGADHMDLNNKTMLLYIVGKLKENTTQLAVPAKASAANGIWYYTELIQLGDVTVDYHYSSSSGFLTSSLLVIFTFTFLAIFY